MHDKSFRGNHRIAYRACVQRPMELLDIVRQLDEVDQTRATVALPHTGKVLATIVQIHISGSLQGITKYIKQATVRKGTVQRLIILQADSGNRDYESYRSDGTGNADELKDMQERLRDLTHEDRYGKVVAGDMEPVVLSTSLTSWMGKRTSLRTWRLTRPRHQQNFRGKLQRCSTTGGPTCWSCNAIPTRRKSLTRTGVPH